jgi:MFS family permease
MSAVRGVARRTFSSLHSRNLRWYFGGLTVSQVGSWVQLVATPWLVLHLTGNGAILGITYAVQFVPILLLGAFAGVVADRYDKRRLLIITTTLLGLNASALGILTLLHVITVGMIIVLSILLGVVAAFDNQIRRSFVPELVEPDELTNAVSLNNAVFTMARIVGPSIAGVCIATIGIGWCFIVNAVSFAAVIIALQVMRIDQLHGAGPLARAKGQVRDGFAYAWRDRMIRLSILSIFVIGVLSFNYQVVLPLLAKRTFHTGPSGYALMFAATGVGSLAGALFSAHRAEASGRLMVRSAIAFGVAMGLATVAPTIGLEYLALVPMGMLGMLFFSMANATVQERAVPEIRGRITALFSVAFLGSTPIGSPIVGAVSQSLGPRVGLGIGAVAALVTGLVSLVVLRRWIRERRRAVAPVRLSA